MEKQHFTQFPVLSHADDFEGFGLKVHPIAHQQLDIVFFAGVDHSLAIFGIDRHGFFADHVFASIGNPDRLVFVQGIGGDDVHRINVGVVFEGIKILVVVTIFFRDAVFALPVFEFGRSATDRPYQFGFLGALHGSGNAVSITTQSHDGYP